MEQFNTQVTLNSTYVGGPTLQLLPTYLDHSDWTTIGVHGL